MTSKNIAIIVQDGMEGYEGFVEGVKEAVEEENKLMQLRGENAGFVTNVFKVLRGAGEVTKVIAAAAQQGADFVVSKLTPEFASEADKALRQAGIAGANLLGTGNTEGAVEYHKAKVNALRLRLELANKQQQQQQQQQKVEPSQSGLANFTFSFNLPEQVQAPSAPPSFFMFGSQIGSDLTSPENKEQMAKTLRRREIRELKRKGLYKEQSALALEEQVNPQIMPVATPMSNSVWLIKDDSMKQSQMPVPTHLVGKGENSITLAGFAAVGIPVLLGGAAVGVALAPHVGRMIKGFIDGVKGYGCGPNSSEADASFKAAGVKDVVREKTPLTVETQNGETVYRTVEARADEIYEAVKTRLATITQGAYIFFSVVPDEDVEKYIEAIYELSRYNNMQFTAIFQTLHSIVQKAMEKYPGARFGACGIEYNTSVKDISYDLGNVAIRAIKAPQMRPDDFPGRSGWMTMKTKKTTVAVPKANGKEFDVEVVETPLGDRSFFGGMKISPPPVGAIAPVLAVEGIRLIADRYTGFMLKRPDNVVNLASDMLQSISESNNKTIDAMDAKISELNKRLEGQLVQQLTKLAKKIKKLKQENAELKSATTKTSPK